MKFGETPKLLTASPSWGQYSYYCNTFIRKSSNSVLNYQRNILSDLNNSTDTFEPQYCSRYSTG